jgi:hypothetical protein
MTMTFLLIQAQNQALPWPILPCKNALLFSGGWEDKTPIYVQQKMS